MKVASLVLLLATVASGLQLVAPVRPALVRGAARSSALRMQEDTPAAALPDGWKEYKDPESGDTYYSDGKITSWEKPGVEGGVGYKVPDAALEKEIKAERQLSQTMKDKMIAESRGLGADPNQKNPFLPVFIGVGVFVVLGAISVL